MSKLDDIQKFLTNDLKIFRDPFFDVMKEVQVISSYQESIWEKPLFSVPDLNYFDSWYICGIVGGRRPSTYSESPKMWNTYFSQLGVKGVFFGFDLPMEEDFNEFLDTALAIPGVLDVTVTDPYKSDAYESLKSMDFPVKWMDQANHTQTVNHILIEPSREKLIALNTDGIGMLWAIKERTELSGKKVLIIGAGGSAASIGYEFVRNGCDLTIINRTPSRADKLKNMLTQHKGASVNIQSNGFNVLDPCMEEADIIINTVPEGCPVNTENVSLLKPGVILTETKYGPKADLTAIAQKEGLEYLDGKAMLFGQFVEATNYIYPLINVSKVGHEKVINELIEQFS